MNYWLLLIPFIFALVGWCLHVLYTQLLFHPYKPKQILGLRFQGLIPGRQASMSRTIAQFAAREFISPGIIEEKINDPQHLQKIKPFVEKHVDDFLRVKLGKEMPVISMFIGDKTIESLKKVFMQELDNLFPQVITQFADGFKSELDMEKLVSKKLSGIPPAYIKEMLTKNLSKELRVFKLLGALTGFIIGVLSIILIILLT